MGPQLSQICLFSVIFKLRNKEFLRDIFKIKKCCEDFYGVKVGVLLLLTNETIRRECRLCPFLGRSGSCSCCEKLVLHHWNTLFPCQVPIYGREVLLFEFGEGVIYIIYIIRVPRTPFHHMFSPR